MELMSPFSGTYEKSVSPIHVARSANATRIASTITLSVRVVPKPKPALASPIGKRSNIPSIWISVSPPDDGEPIALIVYPR